MIAPSWAGQNSAWAIISPCSSKMAHEKSSPSLKSGEYEVLRIAMPISRAVVTRWLLTTWSVIWSTRVSVLESSSLLAGHALSANAPGCRTRRRRASGRVAGAWSPSAPRRPPGRASCAPRRQGRPIVDRRRRSSRRLAEVDRRARSSAPPRRRSASSRQARASPSRRRRSTLKFTNSITSSGMS